MYGQFQIVDDCGQVITEFGGGSAIEALLQQLIDKKDFETKAHTICGANGNWHYITDFIEDGVVVNSTDVDSGISCDQPQPRDAEVNFVCNSTSGTYDQLITVFNVDGSVDTAASATIATTIPCSNAVTVEGEVDVRNLNDITNKKCHEIESSLVNTRTSNTPVGGEAITTDILIFPNETTDVSLLRVLIQNGNPNAQPPETMDILVNGIVAPMTDPVDGFALGEFVPGIWLYSFDVSGIAQVNGEYIISTANHSDSTGLFWIAHTDSDNFQVEFDSASTLFPQLTLVTEGVDRYCEITRADGSVTFENPVGDIIPALPEGLTRVPCTEKPGCDEACNQDLAEKIANEIAQTQGTKACFVTPSQTGDTLSENAVLSNLDGQNEADVTYPGAISNEQVLNFGQMASDIGYPYPTFDDAGIQVNSLKVIVENPSGNTGFVGWNIAGNVSDQTFPVTANMPPTEVTFTFSGGVQSPSNTVNPSSAHGLASNPTFPNNADGTGGTNNGMRGNLNFASRPDTDQINIGIGATGMLVEIDFDYAPAVKATITTFPDGTKTGISNGATLTEAEITNFETNGVSVECEVDEPTQVSITQECKQDIADKIAEAIAQNNVQLGKVCYEIAGAADSAFFAEDAVEIQGETVSVSFDDFKFTMQEDGGWQTDSALRAETIENNGTIKIKFDEPVRLTQIEVIGRDSDTGMGLVTTVGEGNFVNYTGAIDPTFQQLPASTPLILQSGFINFDGGEVTEVAISFTAGFSNGANKLGIRQMSYQDAPEKREAFVERDRNNALIYTDVATNAPVDFSQANLTVVACAEEDESGLLEIVQAATLPLAENAGGVLVPSGTSFTLPTDVTSFTVSAQSGTFDISFDGGATQQLTGRQISRTWGQGTIETISNSSQIVITSNGDVDVIYEVTA